MALAANDQKAAQPTLQSRATPVLPAAPMMSSPWILKGETIPIGNAGLGPKQVIAFQVQGVIGEGGMGIVYRAVQDYPCRTIALKALKGALVEPGLIKRFEREIDILASLQHPGICQLFAAGALEDGSGVRVPFLAMELVHGTPIDRFVRQRHLEIKDRLRLFLKVAEAVEHVHARGIVHRDLTCRNILVTGEGEPKVLDFGLATFAAGQCGQLSMASISGRPFGTLRYMSPEQAAGQAQFIDQRTDVYALGVVLYKLLTGRHPLNFQGLSTAETIQKIREVEPPKLSFRNHGLRGDLETLVSKAICKVQADRYGSVAQLAADVRHFLANEPIAARRPSMAYLARKFIRRHRVLVTMTMLIVGSLSAGLVAALYQARRANGEAARANVEAARANAEARRAGVELARSRIAQGDAQLLSQRYREARESYNAAWDQFDALGENSMAAQLGVWELDRVSPRPIRVIAGDGRLINKLVISPNQRWFALAKVGDVQVRDVVTNDLRFQFSTLPIMGLVSSPDSRLLAASSIGCVEIRDSRTGKSITSVETASLGVPLFALGDHALAFVDRQGRLMVRAFPAADSEIQFADPHVHLRALAILMDGRILAVDNHRQVFRSQTPNGNLALLGALSPPDAVSIVISLGGNRITTFGSGGTIAYSIPDLRQLFVIHDGYAESGPDYSSESEIFAIFHNDRQFKLLGADGLPRVSLAADGVDRAAFSRDLAATADRQGRVTFWALRPSRGAMRLGSLGDNPTAIALTRDGRIAAVGGKNGFIRLYDAVRGNELAALNAGAALNLLRFDGEANQLAAATKDGRIQFWDIATLEKTFEHQESGYIETLALARSGMVAVTANAGEDSLSVWRRTPAGWNVTTSAIGHSINSADIAPDAQSAIFTGTPDGVEVWSLSPQPTKRWTLSGSRNDIEGVFAENGRLVMARGRNQTVSLWQAGSGDPVTPLPEFSGVPSAMTSCDGSLAAFSDGTTLKVFDLDTRQLLRDIASSAVRSRAMCCSADGNQLLFVDTNRQVFSFNLALPSILRAGVTGKSAAAQERWFVAAGISLDPGDDSANDGGDAAFVAGASSPASADDESHALCRGSRLLLQRAAEKKDVKGISRN